MLAVQTFAEGGLDVERRGGGGGPLELPLEDVVETGKDEKPQRAYRGDDVDTEELSVGAGPTLLWLNLECGKRAHLPVP